jgi:ABC-2 type transport system permease protein
MSSDLSPNTEQEVKMDYKSIKTVFRYRFRRYRGQVLGWGLSLAVYGLLMVPFYGTILAQQEQFEELIDAYPKEIAAFIGGMEDIFSPTGYMDTYILSLMPLILGVFAVLMGSGLLASDEESGRLDLILAHPASRTALFWGRLLALAAATLGIVALLWLGLAIPSRWTEMNALSVVELSLPCLSLFAVLALFSTLALLLSLLLPSRRMAATVAGFVLVGGYFLPGLAYLNSDIEPIAQLSPLWYYQGGDAIKGFELTWFFGLLAVALLLALLAWRRFQRRDIRVGGEGGWQRPTRSSLSRLFGRRSSEMHLEAAPEGAVTQH